MKTIFLTLALFFALTSTGLAEAEAPVSGERSWSLLIDTYADSLQPLSSGMAAAPLPMTREACIAAGREMARMIPARHYDRGAYCIDSTTGEVIKVRRLR